MSTTTTTTTNSGSNTANTNSGGRSGFTVQDVRTPAPAPPPQISSNNSVPPHKQQNNAAASGWVPTKPTQQNNNANNKKHTRSDDSGGNGGGRSKNNSSNKTKRHSASESFSSASIIFGGAGNKNKKSREQQQKSTPQQQYHRGDAWWNRQKQSVEQHRQQMHEEWQAQHQCTAGLFAFEAIAAAKARVKEEQEAAATEKEVNKKQQQKQMPQHKHKQQQQQQQHRIRRRRYGANNTSWGSQADSLAEAARSYGCIPLCLGELNYRDKCIAILCLVHVAANYTWARCKKFRCALTPRAEFERQQQQGQGQGQQGHHHPSSSSTSMMLSNLKVAKQEIVAEAKDAFHSEWMTLRQHVLDVLVQQGRQRAAVQADAVEQGTATDQADLDALTKPMESYTLARTMTAISAMFIFDVTHSVPADGWHYLLNPPVLLPWSPAVSSEDDEEEEDDRRTVAARPSVFRLSPNRSCTGSPNNNNSSNNAPHHATFSPLGRHTTPGNSFDGVDVNENEDSLRGDGSELDEDNESAARGDGSFDYSTGAGAGSPGVASTSANLNDSVALSSPATVGFSVEAADREDILTPDEDDDIVDVDSLSASSSSAATATSTSQPVTPTETGDHGGSMVDYNAPVRRGRRSSHQQQNQQQHLVAPVPSYPSKKKTGHKKKKAQQQQKEEISSTSFAVELLRTAFSVMDHSTAAPKRSRMSSRSPTSQIQIQQIKSPQHPADILQHEGLPETRLTFRDAMDDRLLQERQAALQLKKVGKYEARFNRLVDW